jgi:hypothetical protein
MVVQLPTKTQHLRTAWDLDSLPGVFLRNHHGYLQPISLFLSFLAPIISTLLGLVYLLFLRFLWLRGLLRGSCYPLSDRLLYSSI